jgi:hypothetical protein
VVTAADVLRGLSRFFANGGQRLLGEVPLPNGRRADAVLVDARGTITIIEVKVCRADLLGDAKWTDYLDWCDSFYWAVSPNIDAALLDEEIRLPGRCGVLVADRYSAVELRAPLSVPMPAARRRSEHLRLGRLAMQRLMIAADQDLIACLAPSDIGT